MSKSFWEGLEHAPVGNFNELDTDFLKQAMHVRSLYEGAGPYYGRYLNRGATENYERVVAGLLEALPGGRVFRVELYAHNGSETVFLVWPDSFITANFEARDNRVAFTLGTLDRDFLTKAVDACMALSGEPESHGSAWMLTATKSGIALHSIGMGGLEFEPSNYSIQGQEGFGHIVDNFKSDEPAGRMVILDGTPGTGKTYFVRSLMNALPTGRFVIIPSNMVSQLAGPELLSALLNSKNADEALILVLEDCDECLRPREGENNMPELATLLNLTDGIIGSSLNIFVIATTNAKDYQIDVALKRPGRLLRRIHFEALPSRQASEVFQRLTRKERAFDEPTSVATVYQLAKNEGWKPEPDKKVRPLGFQPPADPGPSRKFNEGVPARVPVHPDDAREIEKDLNLPPGSLDGAFYDEDKDG